MAQKQVGARTEGDVYQGLFFWRQAAELLRASSRVRQVDLEHDAADGVDDVAVFYDDPGINVGGLMCTADFFQLKYHVDQRKSYSSEALTDPTFINAKSSLLHRFHTAYEKLSPDHAGFRLHLASNWRWQDDDKLASGIREYDGALPPGFFSGGPKSDLGKIREAWREHLGLGSEGFATFAHTLRFQMDHFGRRDFKALVNATLEAAGLRLPDASHAACPYESLIQQFLMNGPNSFDRESMRKLCQRENLMNKGKDQPSPTPSLGVRSFVRFAERLDDEVGECVCVDRHFAGRHPRENESWSAATRDICAFFSEHDRRSRLRSGDHAVALECHGSLALLSGYELSRNSGAAVFPLQKPDRDIWKPSVAANRAEDSNALWNLETIGKEPGANDIAVALSVTHDIKTDVLDYLKAEEGPTVGSLFHLTPGTGVGPASVEGPDHSIALAAAFLDVLKKIRSRPATVAHLFFSCPNALSYFIGQFREALGRLVVYEFDFGLERNCTYAPSVRLPISQQPEASELPDASENRL